MNEVAERLIEMLEPHEKRWIEPRLREALYSERKATVERIRAAWHRQITEGYPYRSKNPKYIVRAILDAEARR